MSCPNKGWPDNERPMSHDAKSHILMSASWRTIAMNERDRRRGNRRERAVQDG